MTCCPVVELRQYTLYPGMRDTLIALFDREFIESQEALGMRLIGQFRDFDNPNRFVWLRGFDDMASRAQGLAAFYGGPVWKSHREAANATMVDSDNVLLLRPARSSSGFSLDGLEREPVGSPDRKAGLIIASICPFDGPVPDDFLMFFERQVKAEIERDAARVLAYFSTEHSANNFPALPVREGENVFVWFTRPPHGPSDLSESTKSQLPPGIQDVRLLPTTRSLVR